MICDLCPRRCHAERGEQSGEGFCGQGTLPKLARAGLHHWEEPCISGTRGSGTVFFSGCTLGCAYCQNDSISHSGQGAVVSEERLAEVFRELATQGAHNINLVSATPYIPVIERVLWAEKPPVPVVWNSSGYETAEALRRLEGLVDVYLPDLKYMSPALSARYSAAPDYFETASASVLEMCRQTGAPKLDGNGMLQSGTIVRHLILPSHAEESKQVLRWCKDNLPEGTLVSVMAQYLPCGRAADFPELNRRIAKSEYAAVLDELFALGLDGFVQERSSAKKQYIPPFDLSGVLKPQVEALKGGETNGADGIPCETNQRGLRHAGASERT